MNNTSTCKRSLLFCLIFLWSLSIDAQTRPKYRTLDGTLNNLTYPQFGKSGIPFFRELPAEYADGKNALVTNRPNPRLLSNKLSDEPEDNHNERYMAGMFYSFGQFLDHDITRRAGGTEAATIPLPSGESKFTAPIGFTRSAAHPGSGVSTARDQTNTTTSWVDASHIYGDDVVRANWLRTFQGGKLKVSAGHLLPFNTVTGEFDAAIDPAAPVMDDTRNRATGAVQKVFVAGDPRASEHPVLTSLHTLFVREHNRICHTLSTSGLSDEEIYQKARKEVGALMQSIVFGQWISSLGVNLNTYSGYKPTARPDIMNTFATAAYRWHTMVENDIIFRNNSCNGVGPVELPLKDIFFNNTIVRKNGIDVLLKGITVHRSYETDLQVAGGLRNNLFGPGQNSDLVAINIQRGRDHGLPNYNTVRHFYTGSPAYSFTDIAGSSRTSVGSQPFASTSGSGELIAPIMQSLYGDVNKVDLWVGLYAEPRLSGKSVGKTVDAILRAQLERLRDGDFYYFENDPALTAADKSRIRSTTLKHIIQRNTSAGDLQDNVFFVKSCSSDPSEFDDIAKSSCSETPQYEGWTFLGKTSTKSYYKWNGANVNWNEASDLASRLGGTLPRIADAAENTALAGFLKGGTTWLDLGRSGTGWRQSGSINAADQFVVGANVPYFSWRVGEPNNVGGIENRVQIRSDGVWNDIPENALEAVVAEVKCQEDCFAFSNSSVTEYNINNAAWVVSSTVTVNVGDHLRLSANPNEAPSFKWTGPNGFNHIVTSWGGDVLVSPSVTALHGGTYTVEVRSVGGSCVATKTIHVVVNSNLDATKCYTLTARHSGKVIDMPGKSTLNGTQAHQWPYVVGAQNEIWRIKDLGDGSYQIKNGHSGKVLDVFGPSLHDGASIVQWDWHGGNNQRWIFTRNTEGYYQIKSKYSNKVMDIAGISHADGAKLHQWNITNGHNQQFLVSAVGCPAGVVALQGDNQLTMDVHAESSRAVIEWVSNTSAKTDYYTVEKVNNATGAFEKLETVNSISKENMPTHYAAYDNNPTEGDNFYRVVAHLNDGSLKNTEVKKVTFGNLVVANVYPNPVDAELNIDLNNYGGTPSTIYLYDKWGRVVQTKQADATNKTLQLDVSTLSTGQYLIRIAAKGKKDFIKQVMVAH